MLLTRLVRPAYPLLARARRSKLLPLLNAFDYREAQSPRPVPLGAHVRAVGARAARLRRFEMTDKESAPPTDSFDRLLAWLNPDREQAGQRYEEIRRRLIKIFARRGCSEAEDLADETLRRVELNVCKVAPDWVNDPALYFYAVARNVRHEYARRTRARGLPPLAPDTEQAEREDVCLERCMQRLLTSDERSLMLQYHQGRGRSKIEGRQELGRQHGLGPNALRIRVHRLLKRLRPCVFDCLAQTPG